MIINHPERIPEEFQCQDQELNLRPDPHAAERVALQAKYGYTATIDPAWDAIAQEGVNELGGPEIGGLAGVNHLDADRNQTFVGIAGGDIRSMTCLQGACSTLITRKILKDYTAVAINDLLDVPRLASNDMVTNPAFAKRTYISALIVPPERIGIGTVWWVGNEPREWKQHHIDFMKYLAAKVMNRLRENSGH